ncbi:LOW QUALITY PROTEIN: hypothetical protein Cgig2_029722 [Carnegiea gigantea]|uniref:Uncharacterized protein n=1 Tax=Carnegiea gigantea TaxID=171969 RepID=A0A9Q1QEV2_9CARY|nr:LOW QUALITY PROTEIN: hypothetical protein Cgig2_029722 [Carnegiea gigantea]
MLVVYTLALSASHHLWHQGIASLWQSLRVSTRDSMKSLVLHILVEVGAIFLPIFFMLVKNVDAYELSDEASSSPVALVKPSHFNWKRPENSLVLGKAFTGIHPSSTDLRRLSWMMASYRGLTLLTSSVFIRVLSLTVVRTTSSWSITALINLNVPTDLDYDNLPDPETMLRCHQVLRRCGTGSQVLLPGRCNLLKRNTTHSFCEWWSKMFIPSTYSLYAIDSKRKQSDLFDTNILKDEGKLGSKPKLKIVHSGKPLEPFVLPMEDGSSCVKILGIDVAILATPVRTIPIQSIALLPRDKLAVGVCEPSTKKVLELPQEGAKNIMDILDAKANPTECIGENDYVNFKEELAHTSLVPRPQCPLRAPQGGIFVFNANAIIKEVDKNAAWVFDKAILDKLSRNPFDGLPSLKGNFDSLYATILQRGIDITPLESKVEGLIKQACDFKDLQQIYSDRTSTEEHNSCRMEVQGKLDKASCRLNTEGAHYEAKAAELKPVELRKAEQEVIDLQGQIDILNTTEVLDAATKASLEKVKPT